MRADILSADCRNNLSPSDAMSRMGLSTVFRKLSWIQTWERTAHREYHIVFSETLSLPLALPRYQYKLPWKQASGSQRKPSLDVSNTVHCLSALPTRTESDTSDVDVADFAVPTESDSSSDENERKYCLPSSLHHWLLLTMISGNHYGNRKVLPFVRFSWSRC